MYASTKVRSVTRASALALALLCPPLAAQPRAEVAPPVPITIVKDSLPNGLRIVYARLNDVPLVEFNLLVHVGAAEDPIGKEGLAALTAQCLLSDAPRAEKPSIPLSLAQFGSSMTTYAGAEYSQIYARTLARTMLQTLDMLAEVVRNPAITPDVIREKANRMQTGLSAMQRGGGEMLTRALLEGMYGPGHPSVRLVAMNASSLNTLTLENVREFHSKWYVPENMTLIITGSVEYASLRAVIADRFGSMPNGAAPVQRARLAAAVPGALLLVEDVHQQIVPLRIALPGPARNDPRAAAYLVLDRILGEGRSSRLFRAFWGERFIHPSFQTGIVFTRDGSALIVTGNAPLRMADSIAGIVMDVLGSIAKEGVSSAELEAAKLSLTGTYVHEFTTNRKVQTLLQDAVAYAYDPTSVTRFHHEVAAVTDQDLRTVAAMLMQRESLWMATSGTLPALHGASNSFFGERIREVSRAR